jgi:hypothetical protein
MAFSVHVHVVSFDSFLPAEGGGQASSEEFKPEAWQASSLGQVDASGHPAGAGQ